MLLIPLFIKEGSVIPVEENNAIKALRFPDNNGNCEPFELYEDDGITTAYHIGEFRKNEYRTHFENDRYIVEFKGNSKLLDDELKVREIFFKAHIRDNETIGQVLVNGQPVKFKRHDHSKKAIPFLDAKYARDSKTLSFKFRHVIKDDYKIELIIKEK